MIYYNKQLRANLQEWKNRFLKSHFDEALKEFNYFFERLDKEFIIVSILDELTATIPYTEQEIFNILDDEFDSYIFPTEKHHISLIFQYCKFFIQNKKDFRLNWIFSHNGLTNLEAFKDRFIVKLCDYIHDQLDIVSYVLYILEKYKLRTEWFTAKDFYQQYKNLEQNYEAFLEEDLRLFLFDQGIDYPFSTPQSASGRADVVSLINTEDPLVLEIKIWDSEKGYKSNRLKEGFAQIVKYANDYHKNTGYLVVFNIDNIEIEIEGKEKDNLWPDRFCFNGKTYYIIFVNLNYETTASKQGTLKKETILFDELVKDIGSIN